MRQRSETWVKLAARGRFNVDVKAVIGGIEYTAISAPVIEQALFTDAMSVGNCISATLKISVLTEDDIAKSASVIIKARIFSGETYTDWNDFGAFYISKREKNNGLVSLQCYDAMMKANQQYADTSDPNDRIGWPKSMQNCVQEIAYRIGVEIDSRTVINTAEQYQVAYPTEYTMLQVLGYIGACHGGNWIITPDNKLRLVPLISPPPETFDIVDYDYNKIYTDDGFKLVWQHCETGELVSNDAGGEIINVPMVIDKITTGRSMTISRVTLARDKDVGYTEGDDTGVELRIDNNPYASHAICIDLYEKLNGVLYAPFTAVKSCFDPCAELGDWVLIGDQVRSVLCHQTITFDVDFRANIAAPSKDETSDEYPYLTEIEKLQLRDESLETYMAETITRVDTAIEQTNDRITLVVEETQESMGQIETKLSTSLELTNGKIETEVTRATEAEGALGSRITQTESSIETEVTRATAAEGQLSTKITQTESSIKTTVEQALTDYYSKSEIDQKASSITLSVTNGGTSSVIKLTGDGITAQSQTITVTGFVEFSDLSTSGKTSIAGDNIITGSITTSKLLLTGMLSIYNGTGKTAYAQVGYGEGNDGTSTTYGGMLTATTSSNYIIVTNAGVRMTSNGSSIYMDQDGGHFNGSNFVEWWMQARYVTATKGYYFGTSTDYTNGFTTYADTNEGQVVYTTGAFRVGGTLWSDTKIISQGDLSVVGTKNRTVKTEHYGYRNLSALESADSYFADMGATTFGDDGIAYIYFDPVFLETVDTTCSYHVFATPEYMGAISCIAREPDYFVLQGSPGKRADWIVFAKQLGYTNHRLEVEIIPERDSELQTYDGLIFNQDDVGATRSAEYMTEYEHDYAADAATYIDSQESEVAVI